MKVVCKFCTNYAEYTLQTEQKMGKIIMKEAFAVCKGCYDILAKTPINEKELEKLR